LCAFEVQGQGKVVHGTSSNGDKMYVHGQRSKV
jgi:selenocysteine-specific translation elongation factor